MQITFYKNNSDNRNIHKSLSDGVTYECVIKRDADISAPEIQIETAVDMRQYNYCYIPLYGRYYYATITSHGSNIYTISCHCDVLMSFSEQFLNKTAILSRSSTLYNLYMPDADFYLSSKRRHQIKRFTGSFTNNDYNVILATA